LTKKKRVYWDSCSWIGLINEEKDKIISLRYVYGLAEKNEIEILTSTFALAEVFKLKCENSTNQLSEEKDQILEDLFDQAFVIPVAVTRDIGIYARRLLRRIEGLKKPQDAIHLASAAFYNVDELHSFDEDHLIPLDNQIERRDYQKLKICFPPSPPVEPQQKLFRESTNDD